MYDEMNPRKLIFLCLCAQGVESLFYILELKDTLKDRYINLMISELLKFL